MDYINIPFVTVISFSDISQQSEQSSDSFCMQIVASGSLPSCTKIMHVLITVSSTSMCVCIYAQVHRGFRTIVLHLLSEG